MLSASGAKVLFLPIFPIFFHVAISAQILGTDGFISVATFANHICHVKFSPYKNFSLSGEK